MDKIGMDEIRGGAGLSISLATFREQVNYVNPKNKGYVRFVRGAAPGEVTLGKVNNFCDLFSVNWRTNVDAAHNQALRDQMVKAISPDLAFVEGTSREEILNLIRSGRIGTDEASAVVDATSTQVMARRELKAIFEKFDQVYNTASGRRDIVARMVLAELDGLVPSTGNLAADYGAARDYLENVLGIELKLLDPPASDGKWVADAGNPERHLIPEGEFRSALAQAQKLVQEAKAKRAVVCNVVDTFIQGFALNGDLVDYTLPDKLKNDSVRANKWTNMLETLVNDRNVAGLSDEDRTYLQHTTTGVGTPTFLRQYVQEVLGYRLKNLFGTFAEKLAQPENAKLRDELVGMLKSPEGLTSSQAAKFQVAFAKLMGENGRPFDLYRTILNDAVKFSRETYSRLMDFVDEKASTDARDMMKPGFDNTKMGKVFQNLTMSKAVNARIAKKLLANGASADDLKYFNFCVKNNGMALTFEVELDWATETYCRREFNLADSADYQAKLTDRWAEELERLDVATDRKPLDRYCNDVMALLLDSSVGIDQALQRECGLDADEVSAVRDDPQFRKALETTLTYVMHNIGNDAELADLLRSGGDGVAKGTMLLTRMTMLVFHELTDAQDRISLQLHEYEQQLQRQRGIPGLDAKTIAARVRDCRKACEDQVGRAVRTFLEGVRLNASDSYMDILSQGRAKRSLLERLGDFLGISGFGEDVATPRLERLIRTGLETVRTDCQLELAGTRLQYAKRADGQTGPAGRELQFDALLKDVPADFRGKTLPTLFAAPEDHAKAQNTLRDAVLKQAYVAAFRSKQETFFTAELIDRQGRLSQTKAAALKADFQKKAGEVYAQFNAYQDTLLAAVKTRLSEAAVKQIRASYPAAPSEEVQLVADQIANDLVAAGAEDIRAGMLALVEELHEIPSSKPSEAVQEALEACADRIGDRLYNHHNRAATALKERGDMVLDVIGRDGFDADMRAQAVDRLVAQLNIPADDAAQRNNVVCVVTAALAQLKAEIKGFPAAWSVGGKEKVPALVLDRLASADMAARVAKFAEVRAQLEQVVGKDAAGLANSLPAKIFRSICAKAVEEKLAAVAPAAEITVDRALEIIRADVKASVLEIARQLEDLAEQGRAQYDLDAKVGDDTVSGHLKLFVDELLHGAADAETGGGVLQAQLFEKYPFLDRTVSLSAWNELVGEKVGTSQVSPDAEPKAEAGTLRKNIYAQLMNVMLNEYVEASERQLKGLKEGTLDSAGTERVERLLDGERHVFSLEKLLMEPGNGDRLKEYGAAILEGVVERTQDILETQVDDDGLIAGLADRVEAMPVDENFPAEEKAQLLEVMRHAQRHLELERQAVARGETPPQSDVLVQLRSQIDDALKDDNVWALRSTAASSAFDLGFHLWAGTEMKQTVDGEEVLKPEFQRDRDAIAAYRDKMQDKLLDWWRTNLRLDVAAGDVRAAMEYLDVQLELKEIPPAVARTVKETVADELRELREKVQVLAGEELNQTVLRALDGVTTVGSLKDRIDNILWVVANEKLAAEYVPFVLGKEDEVFNRLISEDEYMKLGFLAGVSSPVNDVLGGEVKSKVSDFRGHARLVLMETFGLSPDTDSQTRGFADKVRTLAMLHASKDEIVDQVVARLRTDFKPVFMAQVQDERNWIRRLDAAARTWLLQSLESLFGDKVVIPAVGREGEPGYQPALPFGDWLRNMASLNEGDEGRTAAKTLDGFLQHLHQIYSAEDFNGVPLAHHLPKETSEITLKTGGLFFSGNLPWETMALAMKAFLADREETFLSELHAKYTGVQQARTEDGVTYLAGNVSDETVDAFVREKDPFTPSNFEQEKARTVTVTLPGGDRQTVSMPELRGAFRNLAERACVCENERRKVVGRLLNEKGEVK